MSATPVSATPARAAPASHRPAAAGGLAYDLAGSGPPLVLVHGLSSSRRAWDLVVADLARDFTVIAVDLPGHGDSPALPSDRVDPRDLAAALGRFLDGLGLERAHLVGNSLGGWTVLEAAADGRARSVTALAPAGMGEPIRKPSPLLRVNRVIAVGTERIQPALLRVRPLRHLVFRTGVERPERLPYATALDAAVAQVRAVGFDAALAGVHHRAFDRAAAIDADVPVTVVFGDRDRLLPGPRFQRRDRAPGHARWVVLWRCGHVPMWDVPVLTTRLIRDTAGAADRPVPAT